MGLALTVGILLPLSIFIFLPAISGAKWFDISLNWKVGYSVRSCVLILPTIKHNIWAVPFGLTPEQLNWNVFLELMAQKQFGDVPLSSNEEATNNGTKGISFLDLMLKVDGVRGQS